MSAGLKELSLKVMEQVIKDEKTTYSMVANQLIEILKQNTSIYNSYFGDEPDDLEDGSDKEGIEGSDMLSNQLEFSRREKNIKRRVYDALNVQFAAGVLTKDGRFIKPNYNCKEFKKIEATILAEKQKTYTPNGSDRNGVSANMFSQSSN